LEGIDGVVTDDRVVLAALTAFFNISADGGMVDVVEMCWFLWPEGEKWTCFCSTEAWPLER
jgi:hypothetical protein